MYVMLFQFLKTQEMLDFKMLRNTQGLQAPLKLQMERAVASKVNHTLCSSQYDMRGYPQFFFVDSNSPCKDLLFLCGRNLAQKPFYLVGAILKHPKN